MKPFVSIIVLNWNNHEDTHECIISLSNLEYENKKIIVVDNGSTDGSVEKLESAGLRCRIIKCKENLGYAGGNNIGIKDALERNSEFIWLLNNDTVVEPDALNYLIAAALESPSAACVGSKILYYDDRDTIWFAGATVDWKNGNSPHTGYGERNDKRYEGNLVVERLTGCSMLIRASVAKTIGILKESYFLYVEDVEWCLRARKNKYNCIVANNSIVYHKIHRSTQNNWRHMFSYYNTRNFLYLISDIMRFPRREIYIIRLILRKIYFNRRIVIRMAWEWLLNKSKNKDDGFYFAAKGIVDYCNGVSGQFTP